MAEQDINVKVQPDDPKDFNPTVKKIKKRAEYLSRMTEKGLINEFNGTSLALRENGQANLSAGMYSHIKLNPAGSIDEISLQHSVTTNKFCVNSDEFIINRHKLNPRFFELSDFRDIDASIIGKLTTNSSVLVKAFDSFVGQYMLTRRPASISLFGPLIKAPIIHKGLHIDDPRDIPYESVVYPKTDYTAEQGGGVLGGGIYENYEDRIFSENQAEGSAVNTTMPSTSTGGNAASTSSASSGSSGKPVSMPNPGYNISNNLVRLMGF